MGAITIKLTEDDEIAIEVIKLQHHICTKTKALKFCLYNQSALEKEILQLQQERSELLAKLDHYQERAIELLSGISGLQKLTSPNQIL